MKAFGNNIVKLGPGYPNSRVQHCDGHDAELGFSSLQHLDLVGPVVRLVGLHRDRLNHFKCELELALNDFQNVEHQTTNWTGMKEN